jgi:hypothetical protein
MTSDPYRQAYEKAVEDLTLISQKFERLSARKKLIENLVTALQPVSATTKDAAQENPSPTSVETEQGVQQASAEATEVAEPAEGYSFLDVPAPLPAESDGDPFQRRVRANLRFKGLTAQRS